MSADTKAMLQTAGIALLVVIGVNVLETMVPASRKITHPVGG